MKKCTFVVIVVLVVSALVISGVCIGYFQPNLNSDSARLDSLISTTWNNYKENKTNIEGELSILVLTKQAEYFASTDANVNSDTCFRAASITKTFTAAAIMLLHQEGKLNISDKITDNIPGTNDPYVPESPEYAIPYKNQITIEQLLEHRAGVFDVGNSPIPKNVSAPYAGKYYLDYVKEELQQFNHTFTFDELLNVVATHKLSYFAPGTAFHYSNTGYSILGKIVESTSGLSYSSFIEQYLLAPNGLTKTSFPSLGHDIELPYPYMTGYVWTQGTAYETTLENMSPHVAEGNVITTPNNLAKWAKLLYGAQAGINKTYVDLMTDIKPTGEEHGYYGLGTAYLEGLGYGHNGAHAGYLTVMRYDPEKEVAIVMFASVLDADDIYGQINVMCDTCLSAKQLLGA